MMIQPVQGSRRLRIRRALGSAIRSAVEPLEPRLLMAGNLLYINDNWHIVTDVSPVGLSAGDIVDNSSDDGSLHGLTFGTNAFNTTTAALAAASNGDSIVFVSGSYGAAFSATIAAGLPIQGWSAFVAAHASPAANPDPTHLTQSSLNGALATTLTGVQFTFADAAADAASVSGFKFTGYTATGAVVLATSNHATVTITGNTFSAGSTAKAIIIDGGTALVTANTFSGNGTGVVIHAGNATVSGNHITMAANSYGVVAAGGNAIAITGNTIDTVSTLGIAGIAVTDNGSLFGGANGSISALITANSISGATIGIGLDGQGSGVALATISGNTLTGDSTGVFLQGGSASATIAGNVIAGSTTGIDLQGGSAVIDSNTISGSTTGILLENAIGGNPSSGTLTNNRFTVGTPNATDLDIASVTTLIFGGGNHFGANSYFINNESPLDFTLTRENFGTRNATLVADKIVDHDDDDTVGKINYTLQPIITSFQQTQYLIHVGDTISVEAFYVDQAVDDPHQIHIDWGDGTTPQTFAANNGFLRVSHQYNSTGSAVPAAYLIASDGATSSIVLGSLTILDVPHLTAAFTPTVLNDGGTVTLSGTITEPGTHNFILNVSWGNLSIGAFLFGAFNNSDGSSWNPATGQFTLKHAYSGVIPNGATAATFSVSASVTENADGGKSNTAADTITVLSTGLSNVAVSLGTTTPAAISSGPNVASVYEGTAITLNGSFSDPGAGSDTFNWHVTTNNGQVVANGTSQNFSFTPLQNGTAGSNATYSVVFTVTNPGTGSLASTPFVFTVVDKAPVINLGASATTSTVGGLYTLSLGAITDPGTLDVITGYKINWGDGVIEDHSGAGLPPATRTHTYSAASASYPVSVTLIDNDGAHPGAGTLSLTVTGTLGAVVGRRLFYKGSSFDVGGHDNAIAPDKSALLPGQTAGSANYSSYSLGINGIMVDISGTPAGLVAADFSFAAGNDNSPELWTPLAAAATLNIRPGAGTAGSTRVEITFANGAIAGKWLQVTVNANAHTGLSAPDTFYFGNAIAEAGDSTTDAKVNATDELAARFGATNSAGIANPFDFNRDGKVDPTDQSLARTNYTYFLNELHLIQVSAPAGAGNLAAAVPMGQVSAPPVQVPMLLSAAKPMGIAPPPAIPTPPGPWITRFFKTDAFSSVASSLHALKATLIKFSPTLRTPHK